MTHCCMLNVPAAALCLTSITPSVVGESHMAIDGDTAVQYIDCTCETNRHRAVKYAWKPGCFITATHTSRNAARVGGTLPRYSGSGVSNYARIQREQRGPVAIQSLFSSLPCAWRRRFLSDVPETRDCSTVYRPGKQLGRDLLCLQSRQC